MKKAIILVLLFMTLLAPVQEVGAAEYLTYQSIHFQRGSHKLLSNFTNYDYNRGYARLSGRRFWGWRTHTITDNVPVYFKRDTLFIIKNEGETPIHQNIQFKTSEQSTKQLSASGNIGFSGSGEAKGFQLGLDAHVSGSVETTSTSYIEETIDIRIQVDSMTQLHIGVYGEGRISNGVGRYYRFFKNTRSGGWEIFTLTTEYYSIEKEAL